MWSAWPAAVRPPSAAADSFERATCSCSSRAARASLSRAASAFAFSSSMFCFSAAAAATFSCPCTPRRRPAHVAGVAPRLGHPFLESGDVLGGGRRLDVLQPALALLLLQPVGRRRHLELHDVEPVLHHLHRLLRRLPSLERAVDLRLQLADDDEPFAKRDAERRRRRRRRLLAPLRLARTLLLRRRRRLLRQLRRALVLERRRVRRRRLGRQRREPLGQFGRLRLGSVELRADLGHPLLRALGLDARRRRALLRNLRLRHRRRRLGALQRLHALAARRHGRFAIGEGGAERGERLEQSGVARLLAVQRRLTRTEGSGAGWGGVRGVWEACAGGVCGRRVREEASEAGGARASGRACSTAASSSACCILRCCAASVTSLAVLAACLSSVTWRSRARSSACSSPTESMHAASRCVAAATACSATAARRPSAASCCSLSDN